MPLRAPSSSSAFQLQPSSQLTLGHRKSGGVLSETVDPRASEGGQTLCQNADHEAMLQALEIIPEQANRGEAKPPVAEPQSSRQQRER